MRNRIITVCILYIIVCTPGFCQSSSSGTLNVKFNGLHNDLGQIAIGINRTQDGWPRKPHQELNWKKGKVEDGSFSVEIKDIPFGTYAISVLDDENSNLEMDMTLGIPREGWGFSMNPPFTLSAPKFKECSFQFIKHDAEITIEMRYVGKGKER
ncbi:MAG: DUF2141 domain-containing protein [Bacteroidetes bacterium]|nr:MAG: DUF2141 domain-containing protein [Bacteroidota bacterium]